MFILDHKKALQEAFRVLKPGAELLFNVWHHIEENQLCAIADKILREKHPHDHNNFFQLPYSLHDSTYVVQVLQQAGFQKIKFRAECIECHWKSTKDAATAIIDGSPIAKILRERGESPNSIIYDIEMAYNQYHIATGMVNEERASFKMSAIVYNCRKDI